MRACLIRIITPPVNHNPFQVGLREIIQSLVVLNDQVTLTSIIIRHLKMFEFYIPLDPDLYGSMLSTIGKFISSMAAEFAPWEFPTAAGGILSVPTTFSR
jgi:hypothetical protein